MTAKQPIWEKENPKQRHEHLTPAEKATATKHAATQGRDTPSLVDNINAKTTKKTSKQNER